MKCFFFIYMLSLISTLCSYERKIWNTCCMYFYQEPIEKNLPHLEISVSNQNYIIIVIFFFLKVEQFGEDTLLNYKLFWIKLGESIIIPFDNLQIDKNVSYSIVAIFNQLKENNHDYFHTP